jgi:DNA-binding NtrC family response regulator
MNRILIVEDEPIIRTSLKRLLERNDYEVVESGSVEEASDLPISHFNLIISDLRLPGAEGTSMIKLAGTIPVLIMTSYASIESAVEAMKQGAADYIAKPFNHDEMVMTVKRILQQQKLTMQNALLKRELSQCYPQTGMIGNSKVMQQVFSLIQKVAPTDTTSLILGESGTGKELVAHALHKNSPRSNAPFVTVNCATIPANLIESELFGHEKGAFTGAHNTHIGLIEAADGGTLFLDEIGELPNEAQARLLRILQEKEIRRVGANQSRNVDVRLIAATHRDLKQLVDEGNFRSDLFYRLNVMEIALPPLRDRGEDIIALAEHLLEKNCIKLNRTPMHFHADAIKAMRNYPWPGNVRELENVIERVVILADDEMVSAQMLPLTNQIKASEEIPAHNRQSLDDYFVRFVSENESSMNETELAKQLGISRKTLWERRQRYQIPRKK